jgi:integrase
MLLSSVRKAIENYIRPAAKRVGLANVGWHTFRHTYSTMLRGVGTDVKVQQELLRHADIRTTLNIYTQACSEQKRTAHSKAVRMVLSQGPVTKIGSSGLFAAVK